MKGNLKKHNIFLILTLVFTSIAKKSIRSNLKTLLRVVNLMQRYILKLKISNNFDIERQR